MDHPRHPLPPPPRPRVALTSHPRPMVSRRRPYYPPGQSNACLSLHSLVARKKISTSSRPRPPARPPARPAAFFPHTCVKASRPHTHTRAHTYACAHAYTRILPKYARVAHIFPRARRRRTCGVRRAEDGRRCFRVCNLDSQSFHILLPLEPIHK